MPVAVLVLGTLTILYTIRGGMRAVVWTEIVQASVYLIGGIVGDGARRPVSCRADGRRSCRRPRAAGKLKVIDFYTGFDQPNTICAGLIGGAFLSMASHGADQLIVQRLLSARVAASASQAAVIGSGVAVILQFTLFLMLGVGLWALLRRPDVPDRPTRSSRRSSSTTCRTAWSGCSLAAVLAATMSTHSGAINSLAAASTHDIYLPLTGTRPTIRERCAIGRIVRARLGRRAHRRRPALPAEHQDAGRRRRAVDRVVHVRRPARRLLPRLSSGGARGSATRSSACRSASRPWRSSCSPSRSCAAVPSLAGTLRRVDDRVAVVRADRNAHHTARRNASLHSFTATQSHSAPPPAERV